VVTAAKAEGDCREFFEWSRYAARNPLKPRPGLRSGPHSIGFPNVNTLRCAPIDCVDFGVDVGTLRRCMTPESFTS